MCIKQSSRFERVVGAIHARREVVVERYGRRAAQATADVEEVASEEEEEQEGDEEEDGGADGVPRVRGGHDGVQAGRRVHEAAVVALPARRAVARAVEAVAVAGAPVRGHATEQSRPLYPALHWQMPREQRPLPEQSRGQGESTSPQSAPVKPGSHAHVAVRSSHAPWPVQLRGQMPMTRLHASPR